MTRLSKIKREHKKQFQICLITPRKIQNIFKRKHRKRFHIFLKRPHKQFQIYLTEISQEITNTFEKK